MSIFTRRGAQSEGRINLEHLTWVLLIVLLGACSSTEPVLEKGACVPASQLPPSQAVRVAQVDRALAGTDADRAAANVRLMTTAELIQKFPRELAEHAAACRGQQANPVEAVCDGGVTPGGAVVIVCSTPKTTCVHIVMPAGPVTSCGPTPSQPA